MTAQLAQLYKDAGKDRKFEIVLFDYDDTEKAMLKYLTKMKIDFPAVKLDKAKGLSYAKLGDTGFIPNMVMVTPDGKMVSNDQAEVMKKIKSMK